MDKESKQNQKLSNLQAGDLFLFYSNNPLSNLIKLWTGSKYSHIGIFYGYIENRPFIAEALAWGISLTAVDTIDPDIYDVFGVFHQFPEEHLKRKIISGVNKKYDYSGLFGIAFEELNLTAKNILQDKNKFFCSEFASAVYYPVFGSEAINSPADIVKSRYTYLKG